MTPEDPPPLKKGNPDDILEETDKLTLEVLDNEPGFYKSTMRSMLSPGHEGELCTYLKDMGLIVRSVRCHGSMNLPGCTSPMRWTTQAKILDKYTWKCDECNNKCSIREDSFFKLTKCSIITTIRIILGWCKQINPENVAKALSIKIHPINKLYDTCSQIVEYYVHRKKSEFRIGGENAIILVDVYPEMCYKFNDIQPVIENNNSTQILCLAETKTIPTQYWFHVMNPNDRYSLDLEIADVIKTMVRPGSFIVTDPNSKMCPSYIVDQLKGYTNITIDELSRHNLPTCNILQILDTIWKQAMEICNEAQNYTHHYHLVQAFLYESLWRRKFAKTPSSALEHFLHHIADQYPLTQL